MEVILLERIEKLGQMGDVVNVRSGFARNYLLPQKKAVTANEESRKQFEAKRAQLEAQNLERRKDAEQVAKKLDGLFVVMIRQAGDAGQLYGSVNARDIANAVTEAGFTVERRQINLDQPIKTLGLNPVRVALHPEVFVTVTANVARSAEEAKIQEETGEAVVRAEEDDEADTAEVFEAGAAPAEAEAGEAKAE
jgi:large subunit ribosomal protein L9